MYLDTIKKHLESIKAIAIIVSLVLSGLTFYYTFFASKRADLSFLVESCKYDASPNESNFTIIGLIKNEGERDTVLKEITLWLDLAGWAREILSFTITYFPQFETESKLFREEESRSFVMNFSRTPGINMKYVRFTVDISHDDGLGTQTQSRTIIIEQS